MNTEKYRHYKDGEYEVVAWAISEADHEPVVVYRSLQDSGDFPAGTVWVRPVVAWEELVEDSTGQTVPRFTKI